MTCFACFAVLAIVGGVACQNPERDAPRLIIEIALELPGATAETLERDAVEPVERALGSVEGIRTIGARITEGHAAISVELASARGTNAVADVQRAITQLLPQLPRELTPPAISRATSAPMLWVAVTGPQPIVMQSDVAAHVIRPALERLPGIAQIEVLGAVRSVIAIRPDLTKLASLGLTVGELASAIRAQSIDVPGGRIDSAHTTVRVTGSLTNLDALTQLVVGHVAGQSIRVSDVALVEETVDAGSAVGGLTLVVRAQQGAAAAVVTAAVRRELASLRHTIPPGMSITETTPHPTAKAAPITIAIRGPDLEMLDRIANNLSIEVRGSGATSIERDPPPAAPVRTLVLDRVRAAELGVQPTELATTLRLVGGERLGTFESGGKRRDLVLRLGSDSIDASATDLDHIQVRSERVGLVPLANLVTISASLAPTIVRRDRQRVVTLSVQAPGSALAAIRKQLATLTPNLPVGYTATTSPR